jgi:hypothetical protein
VSRVLEFDVKGKRFTMLVIALQLHERLSMTIVLFMVAMGFWGLFNYLRKRPVTSDYQGALIIGEVLILIEAVLGLAIFFSGLRPARTYMHILYGITAVIALPGAFAYTRGRDSQWEGLIYTCVCLFLAGLSIRLQQIATQI